MVIHRIRPYSIGSLQDWILTVGKFCKYWMTGQIINWTNCLL
jgi:hypothetical protein